MKKWEKEILQKQIQDEQKVLNDLEIIYKSALKETQDKIQVLMAKEQTQSVIYQLKYQQELEKQLSEIYSNMAGGYYSTIDDYLTNCYEDSFYSTMYSLHNEGIPTVIPFDQKEAAQMAAQSPYSGITLSQKLYEDNIKLANKVRGWVSRGIAMNESYADISRRLAQKTEASVNQAYRIVRTEGHRIQNEVKFKTINKVKDETGADIVKQWDSTVDKRTRPDHVALDGQLREIEQPFKIPGKGYTALYPGGFGIAGEDINCRCVCLQRARWALDKSELDKYIGDLDGATDEQLEAWAQKLGVSKADLIKGSNGIIEKDGSINHTIKAQNYNQFKKKYQTKAATQTKQLENQLDLVQKEYDSILSKYKDQTDFFLNGDYDELTKAGTLKDKIIDLQKQLGIATPQEEAQKKALKEAQEKLLEIENAKKAVSKAEAELKSIPNKTYSGIWKDDVSLSDYYSKKDKISAKKQWYLDQLNILDSSDPKYQLYKKYLDDLDEFESLGSKYSNAQDELAKARRELSKFTSGEAFSQERKDNALWFTNGNGGFSAADDYFDPPAQKIHSSATRKEHNGFYTYTEGSGGHNRPLAGFQKPWSKPGTGWEDEFYVGSKKVWIDFEGKGEEIRGLTTLIEKSTYDRDVWLQSGQGFATIEGFLGIPKGTLSNMTTEELQQFVGYDGVFEQFISTAVNKGGGSIFNSKPLKMNIYAPEGSQMLYASDVGAFGKGENEMILQRGGSYTITKIYWGKDATDGGRMKIFVDMELHPEKGYDLFQQDPSEWTGSLKNYRNS